MWILTLERVIVFLAHIETPVDHFGLGMILRLNLRLSLQVYIIQLIPDISSSFTVLSFTLPMKSHLFDSYLVPLRFQVNTLLPYRFIFLDWLD